MCPNMQYTANYAKRGKPDDDIRLFFLNIYLLLTTLLQLDYFTKFITCRINQTHHIFICILSLISCITS